MKELNDRQADLLANKIDQAYKKYLAKSKNKRTTAIREDAFIHGLVAGLQMANDSKKIIEELK